MVKRVKEKERLSKSRTSSKRNFKIFALFAVVLISATVLLLVLPCLPPKPPTTSPKHYQGVVEMWNVESFEGGSGSRQSWITARAAQFEKKHEGTFVHVTTLSEEQLLAKLDEGENFDVICFSRGVGCMVQNLLQPYTGSVADIKENLLVSGQVGSVVYALPLYAGAYCLFARESQLPANADLLQTALTNVYTRKVGKNVYELQPLICGFTANNSPLTALALSGVRGKCSLSEEVSQYSAYENFVANKTAVTLLGTQRDLYRLQKREEAGKIEKLAFSPLVGYTDLVQYLAISQLCGEKYACCTEFLQFLTQEEAQQTLQNVNLFSVLQQTYYTDARYLACENGLFGAYVPNVFGDKGSILQQRKTAIATLET